MEANVPIIIAVNNTREHRRGMCDLHLGHNDRRPGAFVQDIFGAMAPGAPTGFEGLQRGSGGAGLEPAAGPM